MSKVQELTKLNKTNLLSEEIKKEMAPRGKNNPYYRTNEQLADDVFNVLQTDTLSIGGKHAVIHEVTWLWTEAEGKYTGCRHWSEAATAHLHEKEKVKSKILRHDHIVPRNIIIKRLLYGKPMSREAIFEFLNTHLVGCVILREEDEHLKDLGLQKCMPDNWAWGEDVWARYQRAHIKVNKVSWNKKNGIVNEM